jgi:hypothetical protein
MRPRYDVFRPYTVLVVVSNYESTICSLRHAIRLCSDVKYYRMVVCRFIDLNNFCPHEKDDDLEMTIMTLDLQFEYLVVMDEGYAF